MKKLLLLIAVISMVPMAQAVFGVVKEEPVLAAGGSKATHATAYKTLRTALTSDLDAAKKRAEDTAELNKRIADLDTWYNALPAA